MSILAVPRDPGLLEHARAFNPGPLLPPGCAASARSGRPTIAIPIFEEQELNARTLVSAGVAVRLGIQELTRESFQEALGLEGQARVVGTQLDEQVRHSGEKAVKDILGWL